MKKLSTRGTVRAWTLVEVLVVIGVVVILIALLLPSPHSRGLRLPLTACNQNLRQIGHALNMFANDNNGKFPPQVSVANGGSLEFIGSNSPALHFRTLSNYLGGSWSVWHCLEDQSKQPLTSKSTLTDRNLSYFISVDATPALPNAILAGDRNLEVAGKPVAPGLFTLTTNEAVGWTSEMHKRQHNGVWVGRGLLLFADGHGQRLQDDLPVAIQRQGLATNRLAVP